MQPGIFAKTFEGTAPLPVLQTVKAAGFLTAQYNMACSGLPSMPDEIAPHIIEAIRQATAETGVTLPALSATYNMIHPSTEEREKGHGRLKVMMAAARELNIPSVTLCTGTRDAKDQWHHHPDNSTKEAWRDLCLSMQQAITWADEFNVDLGIEPELANVINSTDKARQLIDEMQSDRLKIVLDPANLFEIETADDQRRIISHAIKRLGDRIIMAHAKDRKPDGVFCAAGTGILNYPHFIGELRSAKFQGPVITHGLTAAEAPQVSRFLDDMLAL
jgi:sugar phosphate isomerase/epimerase